jgi:hypothetical protein
VKHYIDRRSQERKMPSYRFAQPPLDPVPVHCLAHGLGDREPDSGTVRIRVAHWAAVGTERLAQQEEVAHLLAELFPARRIDALIIGVLAQPPYCSGR